MAMATLDDEEIRDRLAPHVGAEVPGLVWLVRTPAGTSTGALGCRDLHGDAPINTDEIFRLSSMTKPITAVGALMLIADGALTLDAPIENWLPELADRRVLRTPAAELDETVPAQRPITARDLLTSTAGWGMDFSDFSPTPLSRRSAALGLAGGPPAPAEHLNADQWLARAHELPLQAQPGARWLYDTSSVVLGMLIERAAGATLGDLLAERLFDPLGMTDTGFWVPPGKHQRFGPCYGAGEQIYDPSEGQWSAPPPLHGGDAGLVSTATDYARFADLLTGGGAVGGQRLLPEELVRAMTTNQLNDAQLRAGGPGPGSGWGYSCGVLLETRPGQPQAGSYGWSGGLGSIWSTDPALERTGILLTNRMWTDPVPPPVATTFEALLGQP